jgi:uncharacterized phage-associated protein
MAVSVFSAAKRLAERSGWRLSNLELQKILYLAHMFRLGRSGGEPLVRGHFEAWDYGPVQPDLYHRAKVYGADPVGNIFHDAASIPDGPEQKIIDEALDHLGDLGPGKLVAATHRIGGAWHKHYVPGNRHVLIPNEDILREYRDLDGQKH